MADATKTEPPKSDMMLDIFSTSIEEETGLGKFATTLKDIDAQDILRDARWLCDRLRGISE